MTSANVTRYRITRDGEVVGEHRQHHYCKTKWEELQKFVPLDEHMITPHGEDEHEAPWEGDPENLLDFLITKGDNGIPGVPRFLFGILYQDDKEVWRMDGGFVEDLESLEKVAAERHKPGTYKILRTLVRTFVHKPKGKDPFEKTKERMAGKFIPEPVSLSFEKAIEEVFGKEGES